MLYDHLQPPPIVRETFLLSASANCLLWGAHQNSSVELPFTRPRPLLSHRTTTRVMPIHIRAIAEYSDPRILLLPPTIPTRTRNGAKAGSGGTLSEQHKAMAHQTKKKTCWRFFFTTHVCPSSLLWRLMILAEFFPFLVGARATTTRFQNIYTLLRALLRARWRRRSLRKRLGK